MNVIDFFESVAHQYPDKRAIVEENRAVTFAVLQIEIDKTAAYFLSKGIKKGDKVMVFVPMSIDLYRVVLAIFKIGAVAVFLDQWSDKKRLEDSCRLSNCQAFIGGAKAKILRLFLPPLRSIRISLAIKALNKNSVKRQEMNSLDPALITFTTGSTGSPKGAIRSHGFLLEQFNVLKEELEPSASDVTLTNLPIVLLINLAIGCTSVIVDFNHKKPKQFNSKKMLDALARHQVTRVISSPFLLKKLSKKTLEQNVSMPYLKELFTGGAAVFPSEAKMYQKAFPQCKIKIVYGSTEVEPISSISVLDLLKQESKLNLALPVGEVFHKTQIQIVSLEDPSKQLQDGEIGEIVVAGNHVLDTFLGDPSEWMKNKIKKDDVLWHRTGDGAYLIGKELFLVGRCEQIIHHQGKLISPFVIENRLQDIPNVEMGTILKLKGKLLVVLESKFEEKALKHLMPDIEYDQLIVVKHIPRDPRHHSKIDYHKLEKLVFEKV